MKKYYNIVAATDNLGCRIQEEVFILKETNRPATEILQTNRVYRYLRALEHLHNLALKRDAGEK